MIVIPIIIYMCLSYREQCRDVDIVIVIFAMQQIVFKEREI